MLQLLATHSTTQNSRLLCWSDGRTLHVAKDRGGGLLRWQECS
jgi:hypothetical protein